MLQNKTNKPIADLAGTVVHAFPPNQNPDNGKWRPANFEIETESGVVKVKHFPYSYFDKEQGVRVTPEPIQMPEWYKQLERFGATLQGLEGLKVQIKGAGTINETTMAIEYTVVGDNFTVLDSDSPQVNTLDPVQEQGKQQTFSLDERIAWNSSVNNAVQSHPFKGDPLDAEARSKWLGEIDVLALDIYHMIRRGPVEPKVEAVEPDEDIV